MPAEELEPEAIPASVSLEPQAPDVLLRTVVPPYRLGEVLLRIAELKLHGRLSLGTDMGRRTIFFHSGIPVFSESSLFGERLGAIGIRHGLLDRDAVARALAYARERSCGIGQALLDIERIDAAGLFALLSVQLREVVVASCGPEPLRARFQAGRGALDTAAILRLHPLTAVLGAVAALPADDHVKLLEAAGARRITATPLPLAARTWLADLGYMGELERLTDGDVTVSGLRARLLSRRRVGSEIGFQADTVTFSLPGPRASMRPNASQAADLATLVLLLSGALRLAASVSPPGPKAPSSNGTPGLPLSLETIFEPPLEAIRPVPSDAGETDLDHLIEAYLLEPREREIAAAAAIWGPSVEANDPVVPAELMRLYLTVKPEKRPHMVLGVAQSAAPEQVLEAYGRRAALLASIDRPSAGAQLRCRTAELSRRFDDALQKLVPGAVPGSRPPPATDVGSSESAQLAATAATPDSTQFQATASRNAATLTDPQVLAAKIESLMRAGNFRGVLETFEAQGPEASLPYTLRLAQAMAQRELRFRPRASRWPVLLAFLIGLVAGGALLQFLPAARALGLQPF